MTKRLRGFISFLLVLVLCFGMIPNVSAAEIGATESITETEATEATTAETTAPPDETSPTETSAETTPPTEESTTPTTEVIIPVTEPDDDVFSDIVISSGVAAASTDDYGIMTAASTQSGMRTMSKQTLHHTLKSILQRFLSCHQTLCPPFSPMNETRIRFRFKSYWSFTKPFW